MKDETKISASVQEEVVVSGTPGMTAPYPVDLALFVLEQKVDLLNRVVQDAIYEYSPATDRMQWNDSHRIAFGWPHKSERSRLMVERIHPGHRSRIIKEWTDIADQNLSSWELEYLYRCADGSYKWVNNRGHIFSPGEEHERFIGTIRDITERKKREEELVLFQDRYLQLVETINEGILQVDNQNCILYANRAFCAMVGYTQQELQGKYLPELLLRPEVHQVLEFQTHNRRLKQRNRYEMPFLKRAGGEVLAMVSAAPLLDSRDQVIGATAFVSDITEAKQAEAQLRASEMWHRELFEKNPLAMLVADVDNWQVLQSNEAATHLLGFSAAEIAHQILWSFFYPDNNEDWSEKWLNISGGKEYRFKAQQLTKDGRFVYGEVVLSYVSYENQPAILAAIHDLTEITLQQQLLQEKNETLERQNNEIDNIVYSLSHQMRGPLTSMLGLVKMMLSEGNPPSMEPYFNMLNTSLSRLDGFLTDLVHFTEVSRMKNQLETLKCKELLDRILTEDLRHFGNRPITFDIRCTLKPIVFNVEALEIILRNLITNACMYQKPENPEPKVSIYIGIRESQLLIEIADNGIGIPTQIQRRIFGMFYKGTNMPQGSGLGLYVVKQLVERLNGVIEVDSETGRGTRVHVSLPMGN